ncbi:CXXC-type zinc finger protein 1-like [Lutzomyia longipalpis]|uniref:CXXC-type zinc finger protein 1-like n=1 Tax=Lutzomyia longipalpis TaxID=7200 RepID=UPI002483BB2C|nr:CXXC-type zinc finger protein 1-like [Lutzomyia longipalpis]
MSDKKKSKRSKEEIAKEFDLPERKSKIATIMKQDGQAYCICRSSDCSRFMIGCDGCEEWYHGDCINISEKESKHIKHYYCQRCRDEDPTLQTVFRAIPAAPTRHENHIEEPPPPPPKVAPKKRENASKSHKRCGNCAGCNASKCGNCSACLSKKSRCEKRICTGAKQSSKSQKSKHYVSRRRHRSATPEPVINPALEGQRQCYGPGCRMTARPQSKYCSDECGTKLATSRIYQVLPQRIQEWNLSQCRAEVINRKQLDTIRAKQATVRATLAELDKRHAELDLLVERAKRCTLDPKALDNNEAEDEMSMYCITCGHEIHSKTAIRHMEKCFNKYESQTSFGSIFKTRIDGGNPMFCDFFNPINKTYCKRLRVLCPEHCKDPKVNDTDVCGCPLTRNVFEPAGEFCRAPKKSCFRHYVWEKIRRAEIDLERVRQWLKMDELMEQERQIRTAMASRAGVLGLMLHSTYNHEVMEKLCQQQGGPQR